MRNYFFFLTASFLLTVNALFSQTDTARKDTSAVKDTSSFSSAIKIIRDIGEEEIQKVISDNKDKQNNARQLALLDELEREYNKASEYLKRGIDTIKINAEIGKIEEQYKIATEGTLSGENDLQTMRNLYSTGLLLNEILTRLDRNKAKAEMYLNHLLPFKQKVDSLQTDTILLKFPNDSTLFMTYLNKAIKVSAKINPTDSSLTAAIKNLNDAISKMSSLSETINTGINQIEDRKEQLSDNMFSRELNEIYGPGANTESFRSKVDFSGTKAKMVLTYYLSNNIWRVLLLISVIIVLIYFTYRTRKRFNENQVLKAEKDFIVFKYPLFSSVFICITILQLIFPHPPVIFSGILWTISALLLTVILWGNFTGIQRSFWIYFVTAFILVLCIDLMIKESEFERWIMLVISLSGIIAVFFVLRKSVLEKSNKTLKTFILIISIVLLFVSMIANIFGRYNLSKIYLTIPFFGILTVYMIYWTYMLVTELINAGAEVYKDEGNQNFKDRILKLKTRIPFYLRIILLIGWIILVARNFYYYDKMSKELTLFIEKETTIGDFSFSFEKLLLFIFILILSTLISKAISLFSDRTDNSQRKKDSSKKQESGLSNWMLLIRIAVISTGILLAFAATGLPIDKLTIIIGSLGVGIGLGLQSIVNNLVSGVILAFEKPFNIGDYIEVSGESGRIKEIGIRSSKIETSDGADIIIPNGDLLSKHVINWTLRNSLKRSELVMNIKYGNNQNEILPVFQNSMKANDKIEKHPHPEVLLTQLSGGTAVYKLYYWTHIDWADEVKSELILTIESELKKSDIEMG